MDPPPWIPKILILGPGGIKGFLELGALLALEQADSFHQINCYVGVSIGAILSLLLVAGYTVLEIINIAFATDIFQDINGINLSDVKEKMGMMSNRTLKEKLIFHLQAKFGFVPTLRQLYIATGVKYVAVAMNLTQGKADPLSHETHPSLSCVDAALMSANIPGLFYKIVYEKCLYIDGAFCSPLPVDLFDDGTTDILALYITTNVEVNEDSGPLLYMYKCLFSSMIVLRDYIIQRASDRCKFIKLSTEILDVTGFSVDSVQKSTMIVEGYQRTQDFLAEMVTPSPPTVVPTFSGEPVSDHPEEMP